ncbi:MAG: hypothetical protein JWM10_4241, partial [Myxococcaceae bacterium]|nr:hypothetical protein [Myxococcaceae bacterium]
LADELGRRLDAQAAVLVARGALAEATALLDRARGAGFAALPAAMAASTKSLAAARRRATQRAAALVVAALAVVAAVVFALAR